MNGGFFVGVELKTQKGSRRDDGSGNKKRSKIRVFFEDFIIPILISLLLYLFIKEFLFFTSYVPSASMEPTIMTEDRLVSMVVNRPETLERGDIVVFESREYGKKFIKRLIGIGGDEIRLERNGDVYLNGELLVEDYVVNKDTNQKEQTFIVPEEHFFFLGDNRANSGDAREWKNPFIPYEDIIGKAQFIFYPFANFGKLK